MSFDASTTRGRVDSETTHDLRPLDPADPACGGGARGPREAPSTGLDGRGRLRRGLEHGAVPVVTHGSPVALRPALALVLAVVLVLGLSAMGGAIDREPPAPTPTADATAVASVAVATATPTPRPCTTTVSEGADLGDAFGDLHAGDTLCLRAGDYTAVRYTSEGSDGTADRRVRVRSYPGEQARIVGVFQLIDGDYWTLSDLEFIRGDRSGDMVRIIGGTGVILDELRIHGSKGGAGLLIGRSAAHGPVDDYLLQRSVIYDAPGQSNLYLNPGQDSTGGVVERNIFFNAALENVKIGWGSSDCETMTSDRYGSGGVIAFRYNTLYNDPSFGPSSAHQPLALAEGLTGTVEVERNIIFNSLRRSAPFLVRLDVDPCGQFTGSAAVRDTLAFDPDSPADVCFEGFTDAGPRCGDVIGSGIVALDPRMNSLDPVDGFRPRDREAHAFGRYAP